MVSYKLKVPWRISIITRAFTDNSPQALGARTESQSNHGELVGSPQGPGVRRAALLSPRAVLHGGGGAVPAHQTAHHHVHRKIGTGNADDDFQELPVTIFSFVIRRFCN